MLTRMNRSLVVATLLTALVLLVGATAHADSVAFTGGYSGNPILEINDPALGSVYGYIDPYTGTVDGQSVLLWCVDPDHDAPGVGTMYSANIATPGNLVSMSNTNQVINDKLSTGAANTLYGELAYLITLMENSGNSALTDQEIQGAIWQLSAGFSGTTPILTFPNPPSVPSGTFQGAVTWYEDMAENPNNILTSGFEVVTASNESIAGASAYQEYIVMTPEPSTLLLMGLGLISLFWFSRRKVISAGVVS
jgi:PEP-CTERM motif